MSAPLRLSRETPARRQAGRATVIGFLLAVVGGVMLLVARNVTPAAPGDQWLPYVIGIGFALVGVVTLFFGLKMYLIAHLPETIVEVERMPVPVGTPFQVIVRQPGPIRLQSLRLNVVGEQITKREVWRNGKRRLETNRHLIHQNNVMDFTDLAIARGEEIAREANATVPAEWNLVDIDGDKTVVWRLEVWGRVRRWVDFGHPFAIMVRGGSHERT